MTELFFAQNYHIIEELSKHFDGCIRDVNEHKIISWIKQFHPRDYSLALKLLSKVDYFSPARVAKELGSVFEVFKAIRTADPFSNCYYASLSSPGGGSENLLSTFRLWTHTKGRPYDKNYLSISEITNLALLGKTSLVLLEDFIGSGETVLSTWDRISVVIPKDVEVYLLALAGFEDAITKIENTTGWTVICNHVLKDYSRVFHKKSKIFTPAEKKRLLTYCKQCGADGFETGFCDTQSLVIIYYRAADNVIPILWLDNQIWNGLFPRDL